MLFQDQDSFRILQLAQRLRHRRGETGHLHPMPSVSQPALDTTQPHPPPSYNSTMDHSKTTMPTGTVKEVHSGGEHAFFSSDVTTDKDHKTTG
ncbi:hypothetical protein ZWY2020_028021 [Hordeum vulgare]|nr:hypothetical protein ZWY2020_028021 [Hordeum vulgare]